MEIKFREGLKRRGVKYSRVEEPGYYSKIRGMGKNGKLNILI